MPVTGLQEFNVTVANTFDNWPAEAVRRVQRLSVLMVLGAAVELEPGRVSRVMGVIMRSPVGIGSTSGSLKASWQIGYLDNLTAAAAAAEDISSADPATLMSRVRELPHLGVIWVLSTHPAIWTIEHGKYPWPVARGTWDSRRRRYVVRSVRGWSKQTGGKPIVRLTALELGEALRRAFA